MWGTMNYNQNPFSSIQQQMQQQNSFVPQAVMQPSMQYQTQEPRITVAQVPTIEHVEQVQMSPNDRKIILIQNDPDVMAIRVADNAGFVSTEYRRSKVFDPKSNSQQVQYAPYQTVEKLREEIEEIKRLVGGIKGAKSTPKSSSGSE